MTATTVELRKDAQTYKLRRILIPLEIAMQIRGFRALFVATCLTFSASAFANDPATSPFPADRYDYNVVSPTKTANKTTKSKSTQSCQDRGPKCPRAR